MTTLAARTSSLASAQGLGLVARRPLPPRHHRSTAPPPPRTLPARLVAVCDMCAHPAEVSTLTWLCSHCGCLVETAAQLDRAQDLMRAARRLVEHADPAELDALIGGAR